VSNPRFDSSNRRFEVPKELPDRHLDVADGHQLAEDRAVWSSRQFPKDYRCSSIVCLLLIVIGIERPMLGIDTVPSPPPSVLDANITPRVASQT
jgi:hypothetical protein